jgi:hypothetical protein
VDSSEWVGLNSFGGLGHRTVSTTVAWLLPRLPAEFAK